MLCDSVHLVGIRLPTPVLVPELIQPFAFPENVVKFGCFRPHVLIMLSAELKDFALWGMVASSALGCYDSFFITLDSVREWLGDGWAGTAVGHSVLFDAPLSIASDRIHVFPVLCTVIISGDD